MVPQPHGGALKIPDKGESGNPKGQPPKVLTGVLRELREAGYERVGPAMVMEAYELLLGIDRDKLVETAQNAKLPILLQIVARTMLSKNGADMLERMLDRAHGKPKQTNVLTNPEGGTITFGFKQILDEHSNPDTKKDSNRVSKGGT